MYVSTGSRCGACGDAHEYPPGTLCASAGEKVLELLQLLPAAKQFAPAKLNDIRLMLQGWTRFAAAGSFPGGRQINQG